MSLCLGCRHFYRDVGQPLPPAHDHYVEKVLTQVTYETDTLRGPTPPSLIPVSTGVNRENDQPLPMPLHEAVQIGLRNTAIIKQDIQFLNLSNPLHRDLEASASSLDPQIQASSINFGNRGLTAALSDFSPRFSGNMLFGRDERIQNNLFTEGLPPGSVLTDDNANFLMRLEKQLAWGGSLGVDHVIDYSDNNSPARMYPEQYVGGLNFNYNQPLWAGAGTEFTQIAGPAAFLDTRILSVNQGVLIAKIDGELAQLDFEESINGLVKDITNVYWDLAQARHTLHTEQETLSHLKSIWEKQKNEYEAGRGSQGEEATAAEAMYASQARIEEAWANVNNAELRLRRLLGMAARDGQAIIPVEVPYVAKPPTEFTNSLSNALGHRPEMRRTKWQMRSLQLQLKAATSLVAPTVNLRAGYRVNGFGDELFAPGRQNGFYGNMVQGQETGWNAGVVFSMPIGFLQERAQKENMELRLMKAQAAVAAQEAEISYELTNAYENTELWEKTSALYLQRLEAAERRLKSVEAEFEADRTSVNSLVEARQTLTRARIEFHRSLAELSKAVHEIYFREGSLLSQQHVQLQFSVPTGPLEVDPTPVPPAPSDSGDFTSGDFSIISPDSIPPAPDSEDDLIGPTIAPELRISAEGEQMP